jgi:hypothetical protein
MTVKVLTLANWQAADPTNEAFGRLSPVAGVGLRRMTGDDWARELLAVELKEHVAEEIRELFAVARGAMLYGWFFYPMFTLGEEQVHRVVEAAAKTRYRRLGGARREPSLHDTIEWLVERQVIQAEDRGRWEAVRELRNISSHPEHQTVMPPGAVLSGLKAAAHDINRLFARGLGGNLAV